MATGPTKVITQAGLQIWKWTDITDADGDAMSPVKLEGYKDITAYLFGTLGTATMQAKASPEPVTPTLFAPQTSAGVALSLTAVNTCALLESTGLWYKPTVLTPSGTTELSFWLVAR